MDRNISKITPVRPLPVQPVKCRTAVAKDSLAFERALQKELEKSQGLKISAHAEKRLKERNIVLEREDLTRIGRAVSQAEAKGSRESLIIYGDLALVASVRNKTVVTAIDGKSAGEHVFTNIDSAVIVK